MFHAIFIAGAGAFDPSQKLRTYPKFFSISCLICNCRPFYKV
jgi:hypothetical protein